MGDHQQAEFARGMRIPFKPDSVLAPEVFYHAPIDALCYVTAADEPVRVTFEGLDAIKVCRGEFPPYPNDDSLETGFSSLFVVEHSRWLRQRHAYEAEHYRRCYEGGGDVDEMLTDYDHYLFCFHDEFVEWIAAGIWFEKYPDPFPDHSLPLEHPLAHLPPGTVTERFVVEGITCQVRTNPKPIETLLQGAYYCSQSLFEFVLELDGQFSRGHRLQIRERRGAVRSRLRDCLGTVKWTGNGVASLEQSRALVEPYIREVSERRRSMREHES